MIHIGFTGTSHGMTAFQKERFEQVVQIMHPTHFHHGDCVGADAEAHAIVLGLGMTIIIHPPRNDKARAFCNGSRKYGGSFDGQVTVLKPKDYLARNHDIVDASRLLYACPRSFTEELRSGTWATVRYARKRGKDVCIIYPERRDHL